MADANNRDRMAFGEGFGRPVDMNVGGGHPRGVSLSRGGGPCSKPHDGNLKHGGAAVADSARDFEGFALVAGDAVEVAWRRARGGAACRRGLHRVDSRSTFGFSSARVVGGEMCTGGHVDCSSMKRIPTRVCIPPHGLQRTTGVLLMCLVIGLGCTVPLVGGSDSDPRVNGAVGGSRGDSRAGWRGGVFESAAAGRGARRSGVNASNATTANGTNLTSVGAWCPREPSPFKSWNCSGLGLNGSSQTAFCCRQDKFCFALALATVVKSDPSGLAHRNGYGCMPPEGEIYTPMGVCVVDCSNYLYSPAWPGLEGHYCAIACQTHVCVEVCCQPAECSAAANFTSSSSNSSTPHETGATVNATINVNSTSSGDGFSSPNYAAVGNSSESNSSSFAADPMSPESNLTSANGSTGAPFNFSDKCCNNRSDTCAQTYLTQGGNCSVRRIECGGEPSPPDHGSCATCQVKSVYCFGMLWNGSFEGGPSSNQDQESLTTTTPIAITQTPASIPEQPNITVVIENLTVVNITTVTTEFVNNGTITSNGGLEEISRLVDAFKNPTSLFTSVDLDIDAIICLWAAFGAFVVFALWISQDRNRYKRKHQDNHNIMMLCTIVSAIGYLSMAQGHGRLYRYVIKDVKPYNLVRFCSMNMTVNGKNQTIVNATDGLCTGGEISFRWMNADATVSEAPLDPPFFYGKYVHWIITTNIILFLLSAQVAAAKMSTTLFVMICNSLMILCGYAAASLRPEGIDSSSVPRFLTSKWVFWIFGMMFYVLLLNSLNRSVRRAASRNKQLSKAFNQLFFVVVLTWSLYPFLWIACEGARVISYVNETWAYTILDVLSKVSFGTTFILRVPVASQLSKKRKPWFIKAFVMWILRLCRSERGNQGGADDSPGQKRSREENYREVKIS